MAQKRKEMAKKVLMKTVPQKKNILKNAMANSVKTLKVLAMCKHLQIDAFWPKKQWHMYQHRHVYMCTDMCKTTRITQN